VYEGYEEISRQGREVNEVWETFELEIEQLFEGEDAVVAFTHERGRGMSGVDVDRRTAFLFRLADGKASEVRVYLDRDRAVADLGLEA
jgi:ketosteroid isomerase-like protein